MSGSVCSSASKVGGGGGKWGAGPALGEEADLGVVPRDHAVVGEDGVSCVVERYLLEVTELTAVGAVDSSGADDARLHRRRVGGLPRAEGGAAVRGLEVGLEPLGGGGHRVRRTGRVAVVERDRD